MIGQDTGATPDRRVRRAASAVRVNDDGVRVTEKLWTLTQAGLDAAAVVLGRPAREMGGTAKAAAASGAKHARAVTDLLAAFLQTPPEPTQPVVRKMLPAAPAPAAPDGEQLVEPPAGLGPLASWSTEAVLPTGGTFLAPARGSLRADMVFASPGHDVTPLLFVEVDNGTEGPPIVADKIERYRRFFARGSAPAPATGATCSCGGPCGRPPDATASRRWRWCSPRTSGSSPCRPACTRSANSPETIGAAAGTGTAALARASGRTATATTAARCRCSPPRCACSPPTARTGRCGGATGIRPGRALAMRSTTPTTSAPTRCAPRPAARLPRPNVSVAQREREEHRRRLEAGKWVCPTCQRYTYPEDGLVPGGECGPCLNYRQRTVAGAVP